MTIIRKFCTFVSYRMERSCYCYCCGDDVSRGEKKKRRRPLCSEDLQRELQVLAKFATEQQGDIDVSKLSSGYLCRSCVKLLKDHTDSHQKICTNIKNVLPRLPSLSAEESVGHTPQTPAPIPRVHQVARATASASNQSPPVVVSIHSASN